MWYCYRAKCHTSGKSYVGKTSNVKRRWQSLDEAYGEEKATQIRQRISMRNHLKGSMHPLARLTENDVRSIRVRSIGKLFDEQLAIEYNVSARTIKKFD